MHGFDESNNSGCNWTILSRMVLYPQMQSTHDEREIDFFFLINLVASLVLIFCPFTLYSSHRNMKTLAVAEVVEVAEVRSCSFSCSGLRNNVHNNGR